MLTGNFINSFSVKYIRLDNLRSSLYSDAENQITRKKNKTFKNPKSTEKEKKCRVYLECNFSSIFGHCASSAIVPYLMYLTLRIL